MFFSKEYSRSFNELPNFGVSASSSAIIPDFDDATDALR